MGKDRGCRRLADLGSGKSLRRARIFRIGRADPQVGVPSGSGRPRPLLCAHTKPAEGPAADQGIRPTLFSFSARHAHGHQLEMHGIAPEIRPHQTRQPRGIVHAAPLQPRYHDGGVERHAARVVGIGHRNLRGLL